MLRDQEPGSDRHHAALQSLRTALASRDGDGVTLRAANRLFGQRGHRFADAYLADVSRWYTAPLEEVDFAADPEGARRHINAWTAEQTADRIAGLFPAGSINPATVLALVSATYLDAPWHFPFNAELTLAAPFTLLDGTTASVPMMHFNEYLPSGTGAGWQAVQLPYRGERLSMMVIVPDDLPAFEARLDSDLLATVRDAVTDGGIHLSLPRFELSYHADLIRPLRALGITSAFGPDADFSGVTGASGLFISAIEHETFVAVDEEGTEAAAATGTAMAASHGPTIEVNRPFVFVIQDDEMGAVLLAARVTDPRPA